MLTKLRPLRGLSGPAGTGSESPGKHSPDTNTNSCEKKLKLTEGAPAVHYSTCVFSAADGDAEAIGYEVPVILPPRCTDCGADTLALMAGDGFRLCWSCWREQPLLKGHEKRVERPAGVRVIRKPPKPRFTQVVGDDADELEKQAKYLGPPLVPLSEIPMTTMTAPNGVEYQTRASCPKWLAHTAALCQRQTRIGG